MIDKKGWEKKKLGEVFLFLPKVNQADSLLEKEPAKKLT